MIKIADKKVFSFVGLLGVLNLLIAISWCTTYMKWSLASWQTPIHYLTSESDTLSTLAGLKAFDEGDFRPLKTKVIKRLGAPGVANWNDFPIIEEIPISFFGLLGKIFGLMGGLNLSLLLGHLLAGTFFFCVARFLRASFLASFLGGLAFGLAPFLFAQSPHHIVIQYVWHIPLFILVWDWVLEPSAIKLGGRRFWFSILVGVLAGIQNIYYTYIFCQFVVLGSAIQFFRYRQRNSIISGFLIISSAVTSILVMNLDTWIYRMKEGPNTGALIREYRWLEIYALKLIDLFIPPANHQLSLLADLGRLYRSQSILNDEGSYLGILGLVCLVGLVATSLLPFLKKTPKSPPVAFWQVSWIVLFFCTGGINALQGVLGITFFRTGCRYSVVILAIILLYGLRKMTDFESSYIFKKRDSSKPFWYLCVAIICSILIFVDQVPASLSEEADLRSDFLFHSDKEFTESMEAALPKDAMVFQLPVMFFPEAPVFGIDSYNHLRPYLFSKNLRFSFGNNKGRESDEWQKSLSRLPIQELVPEIVSKGFTGLYVNRNGFPDKAEQLVRDMKLLGYQEPTISRSNDLLFFNLVAKSLISK